MQSSAMTNAIECDVQRSARWKVSAGRFRHSDPLVIPARIYNAYYVSIQRELRGSVCPETAILSRKKK